MLGLELQPREISSSTNVPLLCPTFRSSTLHCKREHDENPELPFLGRGGHNA